MQLLLVWSWNVLVRYVTMGFGQSAHYYTDIRQALGMGEPVLARARLGEALRSRNRRLRKLPTAKLCYY